MHNETLWRVLVTIVPMETRQCTPCAVDSTSVLPFYIIAALPDDGRHYRPKHVVVNVTNGYTVACRVEMIGEPITDID
jgi:hypothetical protein